MPNHSVDSVVRESERDMKKGDARRAENRGRVKPLTADLAEYRRLYMRQWRRKNREADCRYQREWRKKHKEAVRKSNASRRPRTVIEKYEASERAAWRRLNWRGKQLQDLPILEIRELRSPYFRVVYPNGRQRVEFLTTKLPQFKTKR